MDNRSYLVFDDDSRRGVVVDPSFDSEPLKAAAEKRDLKLESVLLTHGHIDHIAGLPLFAGLPIWIHADDAPLLSDPMLNGSFLFGVTWEPIKADRLLSDGDELSVGDLKLRVVHTPGHTPGGVTINVGGANSLIVGDLLFRQSVGRTDLPGGDQQTLVRSLKRICDEFENPAILPGHGDATTLDEERQFNPYLQMWLEE